MLAGAFHLHSCRFPPFPGSRDLLGPRCRPLEGRSRAQPLRSPDQANPLLNVISQTGPEGFPSDFAQPAQASGGEFRLSPFECNLVSEQPLLFFVSAPKSSESMIHYIRICEYIRAKKITPGSTHPSCGVASLAFHRPQVRARPESSSEDI